MASYRRAVFIDDDDDDILEFIIKLKRRPRVLRPRVNFLELFNDAEFIDRVRVSQDTFRTVLRMIEKEITPPSQRNAAIPAESKLFMALRYLATGSFLMSAADFAGVSASSACRHIHQVCRAIAKLRPQFINLPTTVDECESTADDFHSASGFPRVVGAVDCTHVKIQSPGGNMAESFRNREQYYSFNVQCICDANLKLLNVVARWPGSSHKQIIFDKSKAKFQFESGQVPTGFYLLGDGGYEIEPYLMTPIEAPSTRPEQLYNESQAKALNFIDRCLKDVKKRFPVLSKGITVNLANIAPIIVACAVLHNICRNMHDELPESSDEHEVVGGNGDHEEEGREGEDPETNASILRGKEERDRLVKEYFSNLE